MSCNWSEFTVADLEKKRLVLVQDGNHGEYRPRKDEFDIDGIAFIRAADFCNGTLDFTGAENINDVAFQRIRKGIGKDLDTILSTKGTVGKIAFVPEDSPKFVCSPQTTFWRSLDHNFLHPQYLYYALQSKHFVNQISSRKGETDMADYLSLTAQRSLSLLIPDISIQKQIVAQLSVIDAKLQLGAQTNQTLEQMAQAIFESWFVDFDPVKAKMNAEQPEGMDAATASLFPEKLVESELGLIPEGWEVSTLSSLIQLTGGGTPKRSEETYWNGDIPWFSVRDVPSGSNVFVVDTDEKITELGLNKSSTKLLPKGTTIITARGTVGKLALVGTDMCMNQSCYGIRGKEVGDFYNYFNLNEAVSTLQRNTHGAVFDTITTKTFDTYSMAFSGIELANKFDALVAPLLQKIEANVRQNIELSTLRDTLLPKLLSGELIPSSMVEEV